MESSRAPSTNTEEDDPSKGSINIERALQVLMDALRSEDFDRSGRLGLENSESLADMIDAIVLQPDSCSNENENEKQTLAKARWDVQARRFFNAAGKRLVSEGFDIERTKQLPDNKRKPLASEFKTEAELEATHGASSAMLDSQQANENVLSVSGSEQLFREDPGVDDDFDHTLDAKLRRKNRADIRAVQRAKQGVSLRRRRSAPNSTSELIGARLSGSLVDDKLYDRLRRNRSAAMQSRKEKKERLQRLEAENAELRERLEAAEKRNAELSARLAACATEQSRSSAERNSRHPHSPQSFRFASVHRRASDRT
mmetsp:Transcript_10604/g.28250  ORF Transcript_10604/g.28250 Transcript_10604/m.28250 type:complete len:313 (-) Transcript_10604:86-1024(-)